jgi:hypothetical protein
MRRDIGLMTYRFRLVGKGLRHSWQKDCPTEAAMVHADQVARECARDTIYQDVAIRVMDDAGDEIATVPVPNKRPR